MKKILIPIEFDSHEHLLMEKGVEIAKSFDSRIWLIHIAAPEPDFVPYIDGDGKNNERDRRANELKEERQQIHDYAEALRKKGIDATAIMIQGHTTKTIMLEVDKLGIDLIIVGNNNHSLFYKVFMESVSDKIIKRSNIPVLLVPL